MEPTRGDETTQVEHSADPLDRASSEAEVNNQDAIRAHSRRMASEIPPPAEDGLCVDDCGEQVEPARLALGLGRCLSCAVEREADQRRRGMGRR